MTLGQKIKDARNQNKLSQEQLAEKLFVSRQAVTKWESDKGLPDIINLKMISELLDVSIDDLLNDETCKKMNVIKENIKWEQYSKKNHCTKEDLVVLDKYKDSKITCLERKKIKNKFEKVLDWILFIFTYIPDWDTSQVYDMFKDLSIYYLVEKDNTNILVNVTKEYIISYTMNNKKIGKRFSMGNNIFIRTKRIISGKLQFVA